MIKVVFHNQCFSCSGIFFTIKIHHTALFLVINKCPGGAMCISSEDFKKLLLMPKAYLIVDGQGRIWEVLGKTPLMYGIGTIPIRLRNEDPEERPQSASFIPQRGFVDQELKLLSNLNHPEARVIPNFCSHCSYLSRTCFQNGK